MRNKCSRCGKSLGLFTPSYTCSYCGRVLCSNCIQKVHYYSNSVKKWYGYLYKRPKFAFTKFSNVLCPSCATVFNKQQKNIKVALEHSTSVELVSANYKGKKNAGQCSRRIQSGWHRDKKDCMEELQIKSSLLGCRKVIKVSVETDTEEEQSDTSKKGTHRYTIFRLSGYCCK